MKLDHLDPRMRPPQRTEPDMTAQFDALLSMTSAKLNDRAELKREFTALMKTLEDNIKAYINAIPLAPPPDLAPVMAGLSKCAVRVEASVAGIRFPSIPTPKDVDFGPVMQQIAETRADVAAVASKVDALPTDLPEITVASQGSVAQPTVEAPRPRHWTFKVTRNARGFDVDAQAVD